MPSRTVELVIGAAGVAFIGYCIYFDRKRHSDPEFKRKLHERRRRQAKQQEEFIITPDMNDQQSVHNYLLQEMKMGQEQISQGDVEGGVRHYANCIMVCGEPDRFLPFFRLNLPGDIFALLILHISMRDKANQLELPSSSSSASSVSTSDDLDE